MSYEEVKKTVEKYPDAFPTNKIVIEELEKIKENASYKPLSIGAAIERQIKILQSVDKIEKTLFKEETFEDLKKKYPDLEKNCPKSPNGIHGIFSKENMSGCCIYCGKPIA